MRQRRVGLVLGAGGVLGAAWSTGALCALEESERLDVRDCEVLLGTSAGSVLAAMLGLGVRPVELRDDMLGREPTSGPLAGRSFDHDHAAGGATPGRPRPRVGSTRLLARALTHPWSVTPLAAVTSLLPPGRGSLHSVRRLVDDVLPQGGWAPRQGLWVVAMDYDTGRRVPFGREGAPEVALADAVVASCSIPAWYAPVQLGSRRYVDGGTCSPTSVDLMAGRGLDEVFVLAPATSFSYDQPRSVAGRLERGFRRTATRRMLREVAKVRASGTRVTVLAPGREDLEGMGVNLMDPLRRVAVLDTSLQTSAEALRRARADEMGWSA